MQQITREAYMREGPDHDDNMFIKRIADECARCIRKYPCDPNCVNCSCNPARYTTPQRAMLIRTAMSINIQRVAEGAERWYAYQEEMSRRDKAEGWGIFVFVIVIISLFVLFIAANSTGSLNAGYRKLTNQVAKPVAKPAVKQYDYNYTDVKKALKWVTQNVQDYNKDGALNCQDYSAAFLRAYPSAQIMYNPNIGPTGHVFNRVSTPDGWLYIEPQNTGAWLMREAWPQWESVRHLNQEMTEKFRR